ncbi:TPA: glycosyltransferase [Escherichia coli]|nr:glycosyltransferase [Escherichia coli]
MKKKIFIISDYKTGGAGHVAFKVGEILKDNDFLVNHYWGEEFFKFSPINYLFNFRAKRDIECRIKKFKPDVILLHNFDNILSPLILKAIKEYKDIHSCKVIMTCHDYHIVSASNSLTYYSKSEKKFYQNLPSFFQLLTARLDKRSYFHGLARIIQWYLYYHLFSLNNVIDNYTCPSHFIGSKLEERFKKQKIHLLHNPSNMPPVDFEEINKNNKVAKIVFVGRVSDDKGIYEFLLRFHEYSSRCGFIDPVEFVIIGEGPNFHKILQLSQDRKLKFNISVLGYLPIEQVREILIESDYVLLPSIVYENAPLSLVEGVFCKCDIITMNYGGMKEIAGKIHSSIVLNNFSKEEIVKLINGIKNRNKMKKEEFDFFVHEYSHENYINGFNSILNICR